MTKTGQPFRGIRSRKNSDPGPNFSATAARYWIWWLHQCAPATLLRAGSSLNCSAEDGGLCAVCSASKAPLLVLPLFCQHLRATLISTLPSNIITHCEWYSGCLCFSRESHECEILSGGFKLNDYHHVVWRAISNYPRIISLYSRKLSVGAICRVGTEDLLPRAVVVVVLSLAMESLLPWGYICTGGQSKQTDIYTFVVNGGNCRKLPAQWPCRLTTSAGTLY